MANRRLNPDTLALRDFITAKDGQEYNLMSDSLVALTVTHSNLNSTLLDIRFDRHMTILQVKERLCMHIGTPTVHQRLILKRNQNDVIGELSDDTKLLGYYSPENGWNLHVVDTDPYSLSARGGLEDVSQVQKFRLTEEQYDKKKNTLRSWVREQKAKDPTFKLGRKNPDTGENKEIEYPGPETVEGMNIGDRCEVMPGSRRGSVQFIGEVEGIAPGYWVGVRFDEPLGQKDGTVKGVQYFECEPGFGSFVRPRNVTTGDFPELDIFDDDSDEDEI